MSMFMLTNKTGVDSPQDWANGFTFPDSVAIDLINSNSYGDPAVQYSVGVSLEDMIGRHGGEHYDSLRVLIESGEWKLGDGRREYFYDEALYILMTGCLGGWKKEGIAKTIVSHDLCNKTTWYQNATPMADEIMSKVNGFYKTLHSDHITLHDGFMYQEDSLGLDMKQIVKVNDVIVDPSNYSVDHEKGQIEFATGFITAPETDVVKCTYWYGKDSSWEIQTDVDHMWRILKTEVQLDKNIVISSPIIMEVIIDHPLAGANYTASQWKYKSIRDFVSGSNLGFVVPSFGGTKGEAGYDGDVIVLPFNYTSPSEVPTGLNARVRLRIEDDEAPIGRFGTVTFYMDKIKL